MKGPFFCGVGGVLSADIAVPEHEREVAFYSKVLCTGSVPLWRDDLMNNQGMPVIGLGARTPEYDALPLQWMPHFQVSDVAASAARAVELGGQELMHGRGDDGQSQWAVLVDPAGAAFGIIPVVDGDAASAQPIDAVGRIASLSLAVPDVATMSAFYGEVVGWSEEIGTIRAELEGVPAVWLLGLPVADFAESLERVRESGGEIVTGDAGSGYAVVRDPVGVYFALQDASHRGGAQRS